MKIVLCIKQVPDTSDIKWTENNTIQREGLESIMNPYDVYALEAALKLKKLSKMLKMLKFQHLQWDRIRQQTSLKRSLH